jgi:phenylacetic acid degradation protein PaaD
VLLPWLTDRSTALSENQPTPMEIAQVLWADDQASRSHGFALVEVTENSAILSAVVREDMVNGHGVCHGGILFMFADTAMAFTTNAANVVSLAVAASIDFVAPAYLGDTLTATARHRWSGGRTALSDVEVTAVTPGDGSSRTVALFHGRTSRTGGQIVPTTVTAVAAIN